MDTFFYRLREERQRLGLNQDAFAELGGVQRRAQVNYEKGERYPDAQYLQGLAANGVDVTYILTGTRALPGLMPVDAVKEGLKTYLHKMFELDWMRMAPDADYQDMIEYGVHCIKVAAGMPSGFLDDETQPAEVNDRQAQ